MLLFISLFAYLIIDYLNLLYFTGAIIDLTRIVVTIYIFYEDTMTKKWKQNDMWYVINGDWQRNSRCNKFIPEFHWNKISRVFFTATPTLTQRDALLCYFRNINTNRSISIEQNQTNFNNKKQLHKNFKKC